MSTTKTHLKTKPGGRTEPTKPDLLLRLIRRKNGARMTELQKAAGWQAHSVRAGLTGLRKKGHMIVRQKNPGGPSRYQIADVQQ